MLCKMLKPLFFHLAAKSVRIVVVVHFQSIGLQKIFEGKLEQVELIFDHCVDNAYSDYSLLESF